MDDGTEDQQCIERITAVLWTQLREEFPYMKTQAQAALIEKCKAELKTGVAEQQPVIATTKSRSSFMSLSAELRNEIYRLVVKTDPTVKEDLKKYRWDRGSGVLVFQSEYCEKYGYDPDCDIKWWLQPNISKVSRQIRQESLGVYYDNIEIRAYAEGHSYELEAAHRRLRQLGKRIRLIGNLCVLYDHADREENLEQETIKMFSKYPGFERIPASSIKVKVRREFTGRGYGAKKVVRYIDL